MRILSAFLLLTVLAGLALFLTFTSSWGAILTPQAKETPVPVADDAPTATPDWTGKLVAEISQPVVLRSDPMSAAPIVGMLKRGDKVALAGCDSAVVWCKTEDGAWLLSYMVNSLPDELAILDNPGITVKTAKVEQTPTEAPFTPPPTATPVPTAQSLAMLLPTATPTPAYVEAHVIDAANLRGGPGTDYSRTGSVGAGETIQLAGRSANGEWYQLADGSWIAAFLIEVAENSLPVVEAPTDADMQSPDTAYIEAPTPTPEIPPTVTSGDAMQPDAAAPASPAADAEGMTQNADPATTEPNQVSS